jgi:hypothetical protein
VVTVTAESGTGGFPQPFLQLTPEMLEIQFGKVVKPIVLMFVLQRLRGFEQIRGREIVKSVQLCASGGWCKA